jgi:anti-sigma-K factor RskA
MTAAHDDLTAWLGPAALGLLTEVERQQLDRHLGDCPSCRAELAALTVVVGRLGELGREQALLADLRPDPARAGAALSAVAADRRSLRRRTQRWQAVLAAAAAVVVLAAGLTTASALSRDDLPLEAVAVRADAGVQASADLVPHTWGVEIKLTATGLPEGRPFTVQVRTSSGEVVEAGAFLGTGDRTLLCNLNAAVLRRDAVAFVVLDREGDQVLAADL